VPAVCAANACGSVPDGCGGSLSCGLCAGNQVCLPSGLCQPCSVTCASGDPVTCGAALQAALAAGGVVSVCPGRYRGSFSIATNASVIGAGNGGGVNTILQGTGGARVLAIGAGANVSLRNPRITGGGQTIGAGILNEGELSLTDCTITENQANGNGGDIYNMGDHSLALTRCTISDNTATGAGGGIYNVGVCTIESSSVARNSASSGGGLSNSDSLFFDVWMTLTNVIVSDNDADFGAGIYNGEVLTLNGCTLERNDAATSGGGLLNWAGTSTLNACRVVQNEATNGGGIFEREGEVILNGSDVSGNTPTNCDPADAIPGCSG
jgi:predicted outer membrane repeat protein